MENNPEYQKNLMKTEEKNISITVPLIIYICYFLGIFWGITAIIGVVLAYVFKDENNPDWLNTHYRYQIRTFWIGLLYMVIAGVLSVILFLTIVGYVFAVVLWLLISIWLIIRAAKGLKYLNQKQPVLNVETWMF